MPKVFLKGLGNINLPDSMSKKEIAAAVPKLVEKIKARSAGDMPSLPGAPSSANIPNVGKVDVGQNRSIIESARQYSKETGIPLRELSEYKKADADFAENVAREFDLMKHQPMSKDVKESYQALADETLEQYKKMIDDGIKPYFIKGDDVYANSPYESLLDLSENKKLGVFPTKGGFGTDEAFDPKGNPLLNETGLFIDGEPVLYNDAFRAVHDYYGHGKGGFGFRAAGEENAYRAHSGMYSDKARRAAATETRGQNSWLNFGPYGEANKAAGVGDTVFADQKSGLLPNWAVTQRTPLADERQKRFFDSVRDSGDGSNRGLEAAIDAEGRVKLTHYSKEPLERIDPAQYGKGLSGRTIAEKNRAYDPDFVDRSFYAMEGTDNPYKVEQGLGAYTNEVEFPIEQLYDIKNDPDGLLKSIDKSKYPSPQEQTTQLEKKVVESGYSGFLNRSGMGDIVTMFDPLDAGKRYSFTLPAAVGVGAMAGGEDAEAGVISKGGRQVIESWHGSPHDFEKFDMSKMGTGEGAQAYGHGMYTADSKGIAKGYRDQLGNHGTIDGKRVASKYGGGIYDEGKAARDVTQRALDDGISVAEAKKIVLQEGEEGLIASKEMLDLEPASVGDTLGSLLEEFDPSNDMDSFLANDIKEQYDRLRMIEGVDESRLGLNKGNLYEVNIDATPDELLDWDKPLGEQSKEMQDKMLAIGIKDFTTDNPMTVAEMDAKGWRGEQLYEKAMYFSSKIDDMGRRATSPEAASDALNKAGIKGIQYDDATSRGNWSVTPPDETVAGDWMVKDSSAPMSKGLHFKTEAEARTSLVEQEGKKTKNYVTFDDNLMSIVKKYGVTLPIAAQMMQSEQAEASNPYDISTDDSRVTIGNQVNTDIQRSRRVKLDDGRSASVHFPDSMSDADIEQAQEGIGSKLKSWGTAAADVVGGIGYGLGVEAVRGQSMLGGIMSGQGVDKSISNANALAEELPKYNLGEDALGLVTSAYKKYQAIPDNENPYLDPKEWLSAYMSMGDDLGERTAEVTKSPAIGAAVKTGIDAFL